MRSESRIEDSVLDAFQSLKVIVRAGTGLDNINLEAADSRNIRVRAIPGRSSRDVAELAIGLCIVLAKLIVAAHTRCSQGSADKRDFLGKRLMGCTLGVLGCGRIGSEVGRLGTVMGMRVLGFVRKLTTQREEHFTSIGIECVDLVTLLAEADFIVVCLPLTNETKGLLHTRALAATKSGSYLINVSRAEIVDEKSVIELLNKGHFSGVASDVCGEILSRYEHPRLVKTPHIGAMTREAQTDIAREVVRILYEEFYMEERNVAFRQ